MSDTVNQQSQAQQSSAIVWKGDVPFFELSAEEIVYPIVAGEPGTQRKFKVFFLMRRHKHKDAQNAHSPASSKVEGGVSESTRPDRSAAYSFVDKHFVKFLRVKEKDAGKHKAWLDERPPLKFRLYSEAMAPRLLLDEGAPEEDFDFLSMSKSKSEVEIRLRLPLYCPERNEEVDLVLPFKLRRETQSDYAEYDQAVGGKFDARTRRYTPVVQYSRLRAIFCRCVKEAPGYLWKGKECVEENKGEFHAELGRQKDGWALHVPFHHWMAVIDEMMSETQAKN